ncbi:MAG: DUF1570 domain-containing protein [Thermoguttaceae bacterium]|nr:DUF1570 domain-containing protein [Thermoguttaceae bacterium]MDW8038208.1 DUF1570 domain-containing protein [Thermoguttaceae bacterium]
MNKTYRALFLGRDDGGVDFPISGMGIGPSWQMLIGELLSRLMLRGHSDVPANTPAPQLSWIGAFLEKACIAAKASKGALGQGVRAAWYIGARLLVLKVVLGGLVAGSVGAYGEAFGQVASWFPQAGEGGGLMLSWQQKQPGSASEPGLHSPSRSSAWEHPVGLEGARDNQQAKELPQRGNLLEADNFGPMEQVELADGQKLFGMIESVDERWVYFVQIKREPGQRSRVVVRPIERSAVVRMVPLPEEERQRLQERVASLAFHARIESARMEAIELQKKIQSNIPVFLYVGRWFRLETTLPEQMTRRVIVRLEQIFSGYRQLLPPRTEPQQHLKILVFSSRLEYEEVLSRYGVRLANPAVFVPRENLVLAGTDLGQFGAQLRQLEEEHTQLRQELSRLRSQLNKKLQDLGRKLRQQGVSREEAAKILQRERAVFDNQINQKLAEIQRVDRKNAELFTKIMEQTLRQLYHEAFHAYMENYLFPSHQYQVPLWLQEGLAMLFQEAIMEADTLRINAPSAEAVKLIRQDRSRGALLSLSAVLSAEKADFIQTSATTSPLANRYYAYAWAVVYYLCQSEQLSPAALEAYVSPAAQNLPPLQRWQRLIGMEVSQWEEGWQKFLRSL